MYVAPRPRICTAAGRTVRRATSDDRDWSTSQKYGCRKCGQTGFCEPAYRRPGKPRGGLNISACFERPPRAIRATTRVGGLRSASRLPLNTIGTGIGGAVWEAVDPGAASLRPRISLHGRASTCRACSGRCLGWNRLRHGRYDLGRRVFIDRGSFIRALRAPASLPAAGR